MNFSRFPFPLVLLGLAVLLAALYFLQRLRVRHRRIDVVTTLFWKEALEEARARVFVNRFRHPWAYALLALIGGLLWFVFSGINTSSSGDTERVMLIDGSANTATTAHLDEIKERAVQWARHTPKSNRRVIWCGAAPHTLLNPGEDWSTLESRLSVLKSEPCGDSLSRTLLTQLAIDSDSKREYVLATAEKLSASGIASIPSDSSVSYLGSLPEAEANQRRMTALGLAPASSGNPDQLDVFGRAEGGGDLELRAVLDGVAVAGEVTREEGHALVHFTNLPANGGTLTVTVSPTDNRSADNSASILLPVRRVLKVHVDAALSELVMPVVAADLGLVESNAVEADVHILGSAGSQATPTLVFVDPSTQVETFLIHHDGHENSHQILRKALDRIGLSDTDTQSLASALGAPVTMGAAPSQVRRISVWDLVLEPQNEFQETRSFPLFVATAVRWLANASDPTPSFTTGDTVPDLVMPVRADGNIAQSSGPAAFRPSLVGRHEDAAGTTFITSGFVPPAEAGPKPDLKTIDIPTGSHWDLATWVLIGALLFLTFEWVLFRNGRIP